MDFVVDGRDPDLFVYARARRHFKLDWTGRISMHGYSQINRGHNKPSILVLYL